MKEHGMLFKPEMVVATMEDRKTNTRRLISYLNSLVDGYGVGKETWNRLDFSEAIVDPGPSPAGNAGPYLNNVKRASTETAHRVYPRFQKGDRIWVRETWRIYHGTNSAQLYYRAHSGDPGVQVADYREACDSIKTLHNKWRSPIHMPRWACRNVLEVTEVRAERIKDINTDDAIAEGLYREWDGTKWWYAQANIEGAMTPYPVAAFRILWDSINAKRGHGWDKNDWVWVYVYRRLSGKEGE